MKYSFTAKAALSVVLAIVLGSCGNIFQPDPRGGKTGSLKVSVSDRSRTVLPTPALVLTDLVFDLKLERAGYMTISTPVEGVAWNQLSVDGIEMGAWNLTITAYRLGDSTRLEPLYRNTQPDTVTILGGANPLVRVLDPLRLATGSVDITINSDFEDGASGANVYWTNDNSKLQDIETKLSPITVGVTSDFSATPFVRFQNASVTSGDWFLVVHLLKGGEIAATVRELVRVYDWQSSTATITLPKDSLSKAPVAPTTLKLSAQPGDTTRIFWTDASNTETGFNISRNGSLLADVKIIGTDYYYDGPSGQYYYDDTTAGTDPWTYEVASYNRFGSSTPLSSAWPGAGSLTVNFNITNPDYQPLTFSSSSVSVGIGQRMDLATTNPTLTSLGSGWTWRLDDNAIGAFDPPFAFSWTPLASDLGQHDLTVSVVNGSITYSGNIAITVTETATPTWSVSYNSNDATGGSAPAGASYANVTTFIFPGNPGNLVKAGATFAGWTLNPEGTGEIFIDPVSAPSVYAYAGGNSVSTSYTTNAADVVFYAKWVMNYASAIVNLSFDPNYLAVSFDPPVSDIVAGSSIMVMSSNTAFPDEPPDGRYWTWSIDDGPRFQNGDGYMAWTTTQADAGIHVINASALVGGITYSGNFIVRVSGSAGGDPGLPYYTLGYSRGTALSGSVPASPVMLQMGTVLIAGNVNGLAKPDHLFAGWSTAIDGSGIFYAPGDEFPLESNIVLYPRWSSKIAAVSAGDFHILFITNDGRLLATGSNTYGQLGDGTKVSKSIPVQVRNGTDVVYAKAGYGTTFFIKEDGSLWACGRNLEGQLGLGDSIDRSIPGLVTVIDASEVATGEKFTIVLDRNGTAFSMGTDDLDNGDPRGLNSIGTLAIPHVVLGPTPIFDLGPVDSISAGRIHAIIRKPDGAIMATGDTSNGSFGSATLSANYPALLGDLGIDPAVVACGDYTTYHITSGNELYAAGNNDYGQLGDGTNNSTAAGPPVVVDMSGLIPAPVVLSVSAAGQYAAFLTSEHRLFAMGTDFGQFGNGTPVSTNVPIELSGFGTGISDFSAGSEHLVVVRGDGSVWVSGGNGQGQLGIGSMATIDSPVQVVLP